MARGFVRGGGFQRKDKSWSALTALNQAFTGNLTAILSGATESLEALTVMRLIGDYVISPSQAPVVQDQARISVGIAKVSTDAAAAGAGSMPDPDDEPNFPWLYFASHPFHFADVSSDPSSAAASVRVHFDVKTMRKCKPRESIVMIAQYANVVGNPPLTMATGVTRILIAE